MKNIQKLSLSLLLLAGASTTHTRQQVDSLGSGVSEVPAGVLDYTVLLPVTASDKNDKDSNKKSAGQQVMTPVTATGDLAQTILTFGQTHPFEKDFGSHDDNNTKTEKKKSHHKTKSEKKQSSHKKSHPSDDNIDDMTSENADSLL